MTEIKIKNIGSKPQYLYAHSRAFHRLVIFWAAIREYFVCRQYLGLAVVLVAATLFVATLRWELKDTASRPRVLGTNTTQAPAAREPLVLGAFSVRGEPVEISSPILQPGKVINFAGVSAKNILVYDEATGEILAKRGEDRQVSIASLTKLMTALISYDNLDMNSEIAMTPKDMVAVRPATGLLVGDTALVRDVFNSMLVGSSNDAAQALANHVTETTGKNFVDLMNEKAKVLGMSNSHFSNPLGFDSRYNYATAEDMRLLVQATQSYSVFRVLGRKMSYNFTTKAGREITVPATNKLLSQHVDIEAIKTGLTPDAGEAMAIRAIKDGKAIIIILLGSAQREEDALLLKDEIFAKYTWK